MKNINIQINKKQQNEVLYTIVFLLVQFILKATKKEAFRERKFGL